MSREIEDIARALRSVAGQKQTLVIPAQVKQVYTDSLTCTVEFEGLEYEARLTAIVDSNGKRSAIIPKQDSWVLCVPVAENETDLIVIAYSEIESIRIIHNNVKINTDSNGVIIENGQTKLKIKNNEISITSDKIEIKGLESLKTILDDLITQITMLTVPTGVGPSGVPINSAAFTAIKSRLNNVLK